MSFSKGISLTNKCIWITTKQQPLVETIPDLFTPLKVGGAGPLRSNLSGPFLRELSGQFRCSRTIRSMCKSGCSSIWECRCESGPACESGLQRV